MALNPNSILETTKKALGILSEDEVFDLDIIMHINSVFSTLTQLGVGPQTGYRINDKSNLWEEFIGTNTLIDNVKSYMYLRVRLLFDPPATSFAIAAFKEQVQELEWRLNVTVDPPVTA